MEHYLLHVSSASLVTFSTLLWLLPVLLTSGVGVPWTQSLHLFSVCSYSRGEFTHSQSSHTSCILMMPKCISLAQTCPESSKFFHGQLPPGNLLLDRLTMFKTELPTSPTPIPNLLCSVFPPQLLTSLASQAPGLQTLKASLLYLIYKPSRNCLSCFQNISRT